jgi:outer membrane protein assembly factor BamB
MSERQLTVVLVCLMALIAVGVTVLLFRAPASVSVEKRLTDFEAERRAGTLKASAGAAVPSPNGKAAGAGAASAESGAVDLHGNLERFDGKASDSRARWPRFRGADFSNISTGAPPLLETWGDKGPPVLWSVPLTEGHSGPSVWDGRVYVMDYDEKREGDAVRCFPLADGREIWRRWYRSPTKRNHGISRTVPALTDKYLLAMGPRCHVTCLDRESGEFRWGMDLVKDQGVEVPMWYTGQCPLIDGGVAVLAPGGRALMMGIDCATGGVLWQTPNPDQWKMSHSSVIPMTLLGKRTYVYAALGGVVGVSAEESDRGEVLWRPPEWNHSVISPSPMAIDEHRIFLTAGYGGGSMMLGLRREGAKFTVEVLYRLDKTVFGCEQQTPVFDKGCLFAVLPKDAAEHRGQFACLDPKGQLVWTSGPEDRFGLGPFFIADDKIFILNDTGELTLIRSTPRGYERLARAHVLHGRDAWAPMAIADGRLLVRDSEQLVCLDVRRN